MEGQQGSAMNKISRVLAGGPGSAGPALFLRPGSHDRRSTPSARPDCLSHPSVYGLRPKQYGWPPVRR